MYDLYKFSKCIKIINEKDFLKNKISVVKRFIKKIYKKDFTNCANGVYYFYNLIYYSDVFVLNYF